MFGRERFEEIYKMRCTPCGVYLSVGYLIMIVTEIEFKLSSIDGSASVNADSVPVIGYDLIDSPFLRSNDPRLSVSWGLMQKLR